MTFEAALQDGPHSGGVSRRDVGAGIRWRAPGAMDLTAAPVLIGANGDSICGPMGKTIGMRPTVGSPRYQTSTRSRRSPRQSRTSPWSHKQRGARACTNIMWPELGPTTSAGLRAEPTPRLPLGDLNHERHGDYATVDDSMVGVCGSLLWRMAPEVSREAGRQAQILGDSVPKGICNSPAIWPQNNARADVTERCRARDSAEPACA